MANFRNTTQRSRDKLAAGFSLFSRVLHFIHFIHAYCMLYVFRRGSSSRTVGDDTRRVNTAAMRPLQNRFYYYFFTDTRTQTLFFFYNSRLPKVVFGQSFPFQRNIFNHNSRSMGTALNTVSLCNRTVLTGLTSFTARLHTHTYIYALARV